MVKRFIPEENIQRLINKFLVLLQEKSIDFSNVKALSLNYMIQMKLAKRNLVDNKTFCLTEELPHIRIIYLQ